MARRTADETRRLILEAAIQMLLERGATAGVQHIRLQEVLRAVSSTPRCCSASGAACDHR
ncbi:MAG TPA: hypothetical protein VEX12_09285 [Microbacterium sp.]|nr:hypothetical protein [Microbacterium sp.]